MLVFAGIRYELVEVGDGEFLTTDRAEGDIAPVAREVVSVTAGAPEDLIALGAHLARPWALSQAFVGDFYCLGTRLAWVRIQKAGETLTVLALFALKRALFRGAFYRARQRHLTHVRYSDCCCAPLAVQILLAENSLHLLHSEQSQLLNSSRHLHFPLLIQLDQSLTYLTDHHPPPIKRTTKLPSHPLPPQIPRTALSTHQLTTRLEKRYTA